MVRPVRLGNGAHTQLQLDVFGAVEDAAYLHNEHDAPLDYDVWENLHRMLDWLCANWREADEGMWGSGAAVGISCPLRS